MIKLIASDLDGTLVNDHGKINDKMFELISYLQEKDINFAAASGRFYAQLNNNFNKVNTNMIFVAHNGALIRYNKYGEILYSSQISKEAIKSVLDLERKFGEEIFLAGADEAYIVNPSDHMLGQFAHFGVPSVILNSYDEVKEPIYKITYHVKNGVNDNILEYLKENLHPNLEFVVSGSNWVDMMNKDVSKGNAIKILQERFNIDEKNTMVFGDYYNDLTMFEVAHYSYAMKNAPEDVKKHAKFIAESNNDHGVYNVIYKYVSSI